MKLYCDYQKPFVTNNVVSEEIAQPLFISILIKLTMLKELLILIF